MAVWNCVWKISAHFIHQISESLFTRFCGSLHPCHSAIVPASLFSFSKRYWNTHFDQAFQNPFFCHFCFCPPLTEIFSRLSHVKQGAPLQKHLALHLTEQVQISSWKAFLSIARRDIKRAEEIFQLEFIHYCMLITSFLRREQSVLQMNTCERAFGAGFPLRFYCFIAIFNQAIIWSKINSKVHFNSTTSEQIIKTDEWNNNQPSLFLGFIHVFSSWIPCCMLKCLFWRKIYSSFSLFPLGSES